MNVLKHSYIAISVKNNLILALIDRNVINYIQNQSNAYIRLYERITHDNVLITIVMNNSTASSVIVFNESYITKCY